MIVSDYPEFSWSLSRHKTVLDCGSKYGKSYYFSHNGWLKNANPITKHIYRLKKMTNLDMLLGEKVHEYIEGIIANKIDEKFSEKSMLEDIWKDIEQTIEYAYRDYNKWYEKPSSIQMLHEIYYENDVSTEKILELKGKLETIAHNFFQNEIFEKMKQKEVYIHQDSERFRYLNNNGIKIWIKMDLHYTDPMTHKKTVVDWKTGNANKDDRYQLSLYAHYISRAYKLSDLDNIEIRNEYLLFNQSKSYTLQKVDINSMKELVNLSIENMQKYLVNIEKNIPLEESYFPKTENQSICNRCNYKEICQSV